MDGCAEVVGRSERWAEVVRRADRQADVSDGHGRVGGRLIGHGEVDRNRQVSGNGGMGGSGWVIRGAGASDRTSEQMIGHTEWTQRGAGRSRQTQRGKTFSLGSHCKTSSLCIVWKLWVIKYKNDDRVAQWLKTSQAMSGRVR